MLPGCLCGSPLGTAPVLKNAIDLQGMAPSLCSLLQSPSSLWLIGNTSIEKVPVWWTGFFIQIGAKRRQWYFLSWNILCISLLQFLWLQATMLVLRERCGLWTQAPCKWCSSSPSSVCLSISLFLSCSRLALDFPAPLILNPLPCRFFSCQCLPV